MDEQVSNFQLSKKAKQLLKDRSRLKKGLREGKSPQELLEIKDKQMDAFFRAATKLYQGERYDEAEKAFFFLVSLNAKKYDYWIGLAMACQMSGKYEEAIDAYEMAISRRITHPVPYFYLAKCLFAIHDRQNALIALELAIQYAKESEEFSDLIKQAMAAKAILMKTNG